MKRKGFEESIIALRKWQPAAYSIRRGECHCPHKAVLVSFLLPHVDREVRDFDTGRVKPGVEACGFFCASCGFGNAGSRPKHKLLPM